MTSCKAVSPDKTQGVYDKLIKIENRIKKYIS